MYWLTLPPVMTVPAIISVFRLQRMFLHRRAVSSDPSPGQVEREALRFDPELRDEGVLKLGWPCAIFQDHHPIKL